MHRKQQLFSIMKSNGQIFELVNVANGLLNYRRIWKNLHAEFAKWRCEFFVMEFWKP